MSASSTPFVIPSRRTATAGGNQQPVAATLNSLAAKLQELVGRLDEAELEAAEARGSLGAVPGPPTSSSG